MSSHTIEKYFFNDMSSDDVLKYMITSGKVNLQQIQEEIAMSKRQEILNQHTYSIYQGKDGKWYTYLPDKENKRRKIKKTTKQALEQVVIDFWQNETYNPTIEDVFKEWNDRRLLLGQIVDSTHLRNRRIFNRYYSDVKDMHIKQTTPQFIEDLLERQIPKYNLSTKDFANLKTVTKGFFKRARKNGLVSFNIEQVFMDMDISENAFRKISKEDCNEVYNEEETKIILEYLHSNLDIHNMGILLLFVTGLRVGELVSLSPKDIQKGKLVISKTETKFERDGKAVFEVAEKPKTEAGFRNVIVPPDYEWLLRGLLHQNPFGEYVFMYKGKRMKEEAIRKRLERVCKKLGIKYKPPHKIRKTYGTILMDSGVSARFITDQMGHTDISCTKQFYYRNRKSDDKKAEILDGILEFQNKYAQ